MIQTYCLGKKSLQSHHSIHVQFAFLFLNLSALHTNVYLCVYILLDFLRWLSGATGDTGLMSGLRRSPGEGNGNPLRYSCMGNPMDRRTQQATVHGITKEPDTS